jgi:tetratricopeptide (TPR) repeat protein
VRTRISVLMLTVLLAAGLIYGCGSEYMTGAKVHIQNGEYSEAIPLLGKEIETNPGNVEAHVLIGQSYCEIEDFVSGSEAFDAAEALIAADPEGKYRGELNQTRMFYWSKAFETGRIPFNAAVTLLEEGKTDEAAVKFREAISGYEACDQIFDGHPKNQFMLGFSYEKLGEFDKAFNSYGKALAVKKADIAANDFDAQTNLSDYVTKYANAALKTGRFDEAREILERLTADEPDNTELLYAFAVLLLNTEEYDEAAEALERVLEIDPGFDAAIISIGNLYLKEGWSGRDARKAIDILEPLLETEKYKDDFQIYASLGTAYKNLGDNKKAAQYYQKAQELYDAQMGGE